MKGYEPGTLGHELKYYKDFRKQEDKYSSVEGLLALGEDIMTKGLEKKSQIKFQRRVSQRTPIKIYNSRKGKTPF